jgi:hypothetical protein
MPSRYLIPAAEEGVSFALDVGHEIDRNPVGEYVPTGFRAMRVTVNFPDRDPVVVVGRMFDEGTPEYERAIDAIEGRTL